jgi:hypothetical protein
MGVYLSFIGKKYYNKERFIVEGLKYGVQRIAPFNVVYNLYKNKSIVYYAFMNEKYNVAKVFAYGNVIGVATTDQYINNKMKAKYGNIKYKYEHRGCGSCYAASYTVDYNDILELLEEAKERYRNSKVSYRWFYLTDIDVYDTTIDNIIEYKPKAKHMIVKDVLFSRNLIKLNGVHCSGKSSKYAIKSVIRHRLKGKGIDDIKPKIVVDTSKYTNLDRWIVGLC